MKKPELLAPAGDLTKLKAAVLYGADAVYVGGEHFGLRAAAGNFSFQDLKEGVAFAHQHGVKVYVTANIFPHQEDFKKLPYSLETWVSSGVDAVIVSDLGLFFEIQKLAPELEIHISTQANNVNAWTINAWHRLGAKRVVLARELTFDEIKSIYSQVDSDCELEMFVHGAMCISYSGRCLLSNYMTGRDSNGGACAQPCRWQYSLMEEKRPGEYFPVFEDEKGTYIFNSRDLNLLPYLPQIIELGIASLKIEGRVKSDFYVATVTKVYREAIDSYFENPEKFQIQDRWLNELSSVSHRVYGPGFFNGNPKSDGQIYGSSSYIRDYEVVGIVEDWKDGVAFVEQRNRFFSGDVVEFMPPNMPDFKQKISWMKDGNGEMIQSAPHPQMKLLLPCDRKVPPHTFIKVKK